MATDHDPATCEICHEQGMDAEVEALKAERDRYRAALEEILAHPWYDREKNDDRGCADMHEARIIAREALGSEATP